MERLFAARVAAYSAAQLRIEAAGVHAEEVAERVLEALHHLEPLDRLCSPVFPCVSSVAYTTACVI